MHNEPNQKYTKNKNKNQINEHEIQKIITFRYNCSCFVISAYFWKLRDTETFRHDSVRKQYNVQTSQLSDTLISKSCSNFEEKPEQFSEGKFGAHRSQIRCYLLFIITWILAYLSANHCRENTES